MIHGRRQPGFTLVELLITVIVLGVTISIAVPSFQSYILDSRVRTGAQQLFNDLTFARSEALKRNTNVTVVPSDSSNWEEGWVVSLGAKGYTACQSDQSDCLSIQQPLEGLAIASAAAQVQFQANGRAAAQVAFDVCDAEKSAEVTERRVTTSLTGRPNVERNGACS